MPTLFLSYRRADNPDTVKLIHERLQRRLPRWEIFYDHASIPLGESFPERLRAKVAAATVVLVIIGPRWVKYLHDHLGQEVDHVRAEVSMALQAAASVVPVLVGHARMPADAELAAFPDLQPLLQRNGRSVRPDPDFDSDLEAIITHIRQLDSDEVIGATLADRYALVAEIGHGGMGIVYLAEQKQPVQRRVAVKLIKPGMDSREILARFEAERQALALMDHPNIARVLDAGRTAQGRPFFVMEYVPGVPVTQYCDDKKLTPHQRLNLFIPVCNAVQHAHQKGILHRDLKPSNVLVTVVDGLPVAKVIDFGLAKALGHKLTDRTLHTGLDVRIGTLEYSSPEQAAGRYLEVDTRSDIYSLGVLLYELLTGEPPFTHEDLLRIGEEEMRRVIRENEPPRPSKKLSSSGALPVIAANRQVDPGRLTRLLQGDLDWIVMKCLEKENARRYETANLLGMELQRFLADEPVQARPPSARYRMRKFLRRNRRSVVAGVLVLLSLVGGIIGTTLALFHAIEQTKRAENAEKEAADKARLAQQREQQEVQAKKKALQSLADFYLERGRNLVAAGNSSGLVWMARALQAAPKEDQGRQHLIRANLALCSRQLHVLTGAFPGHGILSPDRTTLLTYNGKVSQLWKCADATPISPSLVQDSEVRYGKFSPDGKTVLILSEGGMRLWSVPEGLPVGPKHKGHITTAAFSPNSKFLCVAEEKRGLTADGKTEMILEQWAQLWSATDGSRIGKVLKTNVYDILFSADGQTVVTTSHDSASLWSTRDGSAIGRPLTIEGGLQIRATPSPDGKKVLVWRTLGKLAQLYSIAGASIGSPISHENNITACVFSPDSATIVTASSDRTARLWSTRDGAPIGQAMKHEAEVWKVTFSPDGKQILTSSQDKTAHLWSAADGTPVGQSMKHAAAVQSALFSPDGATILTRDTERDTLRLWRAADGILLGPPVIHSRAILAEAFSPDGRKLLTTGSDKTARLWSTVDVTPLGPAMSLPEDISDVTFTADGKHVLMDNDKGARLWNIGDELALGRFVPKPHWSLRAIFSPDGKRILTGSGQADRNGRTGSGEAQLWSAVDGTAVGLMLPHTLPVRVLAFSPDGKTILTGTAITDGFGITGRGSIQRWSAADGRPLGSALSQPYPIHDVAFSPDGKTLLIGMGKTDDTLRSEGAAGLWNVEDGSLIKYLPHEGSVRTVAFCPQGDRVLTGSTDGVARLWSARDGTSIGQVMKHENGVSHVAFSSDGKMLVTSSWDGKARLWSAADGTPLAVPLTHQAPVSAAVFSPDGSTVLTASADRTARLWNARTGAPFGSPLIHQAAVNTAVFSPDGTMVLTASEDKTSQLWSAASGLPIGLPLRHSDEVYAAQFRPDGRAVLTNSRSGFRLWRLPPVPAEGPDDIALWAQLLTGMELRESDTGSTMEPFDATRWQECRKRWSEQGGLPLW